MHPNVFTVVRKPALFIGVVLISVLALITTTTHVSAQQSSNPALLPSYHWITFNGHQYQINMFGATPTGATPQDAEAGFIPTTKGESLGPVHSLPNCYSPPPQSQRDHATFSRDELQKYGLPFPETVSGGLNEWKQIVRAADKRTCSSRTKYFNGLPERAGAMDKPAVESSLMPHYQGTYAYQHTGQNAWSGWTDDGYNYSYPGLFTGMEGYHTIPQALAYPGLDLGVYAISSWYGIGGFFDNGCGWNGPQLLQDGSTATYSSYNYIYDLWYENTGWTGNCGVQSISGQLARNPTYGDYIYTQVSSIGKSYTTTWIYIQDRSITSGTNYFSGYVGGNAPSPTSAECVVEPTSSGSPGPYNFSVTFKYCQTGYWLNGNNSWGESGIGNVPYAHYRMLQQWSSYYNAACINVGNFSDGNNWTYTAWNNNLANNAGC